MRSYFSHDSNARNSDKLMKVRMKLGAEGYGIFFMLIERLREEEGYKSTIDYNTLAFDLRVDAEKVKQVVEDYDLFKFTEDGKYFYSDSFNERMEMMDVRAQQRKSKAKKAAEARWNKQSEDTSNAQALPKQCSSNAQALLNHANKIKLNKIKLNKTKINKSKVVVAETNEAENLADEPATTTEQKQISDVLNFYENHFGMISDYIRQSILKWCNDLNPELVKRALEISVEDNVLKFRYANAIMVDWDKKGIDTLEKALAEGNARQKSKQNNYNKPSGYVEIVPDWVK
nr:MAG TPA: DnaD like replication protein [Caudoviricetes sp.]